MPFHVIIPSRYGATRLPGKPLRALVGRPMIEHVHRRGRESGALTVRVAADDERIAEVVRGFGGEVVMTSPDHASGTDRLAEVAAKVGLPDEAVVVNLQGDEPCMAPEAIRRVAELCARQEGILATLATPLRSPAELWSADVVKVVLDDAGFARWFSRAPLPWVRDAFRDGPPERLPEGVPFLRHLGLYAYRVGLLRRICDAPPHPHERAESLEQLRAVAMGIPIAVGVVDEPPGHGVDTEADLAAAEAWLRDREGSPTSGGQSPSA
ncbi:MAG: 3-deoxy-manno-octulosonate cytidylyltransferase [Polyangiaceae bacterium]